MDTIFTLILPEGTEAVTATLIAKRGNYAHMDSFSYTGTNLLTAMQVAVGELDLLERIPPQIEVATSEASPTSHSKDKSPKASKPKKKKVSLDDMPDEEVDWGEADTEEIPVAEIAKAEPKSAQSGQTIPSPKMSTSVQVGDRVNLPTGAVDADGDPVPFQQGRIVEIDHDAEMPRVWVESMDSEQDAWLKLSDLEVMSKSLAVTVPAKPVGMGLPNTDGQLTLFS